VPAEILAAAARWQRRSSDANCLCCAVSAKSAKIRPAKRADFDPNGFRSSSLTTPATQSVSATADNHITVRVDAMNLKNRLCDQTLAVVPGFYEGSVIKLTAS
jgi:hypothetical protein